VISLLEQHQPEPAGIRSISPFLGIASVWSFRYIPGLIFWKNIVDKVHTHDLEDLNA
jgi:hypothetical protein